jgi:hypothetical protein
MYTPPVGYEKIGTRARPAIVTGAPACRPRAGHGGQRMGKTLFILLGTSLNTCQNFGINS